MTTPPTLPPLPPILAAKARNPLQAGLATILGLLPPEQLQTILTESESKK